MKKFISSILLLLSAFATPGQSGAFAQGEEPDSGAVVCAPDMYFIVPDDCLPLGPSSLITEMARLGLSHPPRPLLYRRPDPSLTNLPYLYFRLEEENVPVLNGPAGVPTGQVYAAGFVYLSYLDRVDTGNGIYYMLESGNWIPGAGSRVGEYSRFQGLEFTSTPRNRFAWTLPFYAERTPVRIAPGFNTPLSEKYLLPYTDIVQVYDTKNVDGVDWNMIGPNEWVEARVLAMVTPKTAPPEGVANNRWIDVDLSEQTLAVYDNYEMVFATVIASGLEPFWTRPGLFQIYEKKKPKQCATAIQQIIITSIMSHGRCISTRHELAWSILAHKVWYPQSHGCVNLSVGDSHWLFNWANLRAITYMS
jgi:hypothetical protein